MASSSSNSKLENNGLETDSSGISTTVKNSKTKNKNEILFKFKSQITNIPLVDEIMNSYEKIRKSLISTESSNKALEIKKIEEIRNIRGN